jgi:hypothetical protein
MVWPQENHQLNSIYFILTCLQARLAEVITQLSPVTALDVHWVLDGKEQLAGPLAAHALTPPVHDGNAVWSTSSNRNQHHNQPQHGLTPPVHDGNAVWSTYSNRNQHHSQPQHGLSSTPSCDPGSAANDRTSPSSLPQERPQSHSSQSVQQQTRHAAALASPRLKVPVEVVSPPAARAPASPGNNYSK